MELMVHDEILIECRKCERLVNWREEIAFKKKKLFIPWTIGENQFRVSVTLTAEFWWLVLLLERMVQIEPGGCSREIPLVISYLPPYIGPVLQIMRIHIR